MSNLESDPKIGICDPWFIWANLKISDFFLNFSRPIACGETLRRLTAKLLSTRHKDAARRILMKGKQVGVAVQRGLEAGVAVVAQWAERAKATAAGGGPRDAVVLKIDFKNAFNSVHREAFLEVVERDIPGLLPFAQWCYGSPSTLSYSGHVFQSTCGVQQGDPLGPLLFSLAIKELAEMLVGHFAGCGGSVFYLDDGVLMGPAGVVKEALDFVVKWSKEKGLEVKLDKCELIDLNRLSKTELEAQGFLLRLPDETDKPGVVYREGGDFTLLGTPIGSREFCERYMDEKLAEFAPYLEALATLEDRQVALALLRHCEGFARLVFYMRALGHRGATEYLAKSDAAVEKCLTRILCLADDTLPDDAMRQATLPVRVGGLGIRRSTEHWHAAAMASMQNGYLLCRELDKEFTWDTAAWHTLSSAYNNDVSEGDAVDSESRPTEMVKQKDLSLAIIDVHHRDLHERADASDRARYRSLSLPHAGATYAGKLTEETRVGGEEMVVVTRHRLGISLFEPDAKCGRCGQEMDTHGTHALNCRVGGGPTRRHDVVRDSLYRLAVEAGTSPEMETLHILPDSQERPGDIVTRRVWPRVIDVTIRNPLAASVVQAAARFTGAAAAAGEAEKNRRYRDPCRRSGQIFAAFAMEAFGGLGPSAHQVFGKLGRLAAERTGRSRVLVTQSHATRVSSAYSHILGRTLLECGPISPAAVSRTALATEAAAPLNPDHFMRFSVDSRGEGEVFIDPDEERPVPQADPVPRAEAAPTSPSPSVVIEKWRDKRGGARVAIEDLAEGLGNALTMPEQVAALGGSVAEGAPATWVVAVTAAACDLGFDIDADKLLRLAVVCVRRAPTLRLLLSDPDEWAGRMLASGGGEDVDQVALRGVAVALDVHAVVFRDNLPPLLVAPGEPCQALFVGGVDGGFKPVTVPDQVVEQVTYTKCVEVEVPQGPVIPGRVDVSGSPGCCQFCASLFTTAVRHGECGHCSRMVCPTCCELGEDDTRCVCTPLPLPREDQGVAPHPPGQAEPPPPPPASTALTKALLEGRAPGGGDGLSRLQRSLGMQECTGFRFTPGDCFFDAAAFIMGGSAAGMRRLAVQAVLRDPGLCARAEPNSESWAAAMRVEGSRDEASWADQVAVHGLALGSGWAVVVLSDQAPPTVHRPRVKPFVGVLGVKHQGKHYTPLLVPPPLAEAVSALAPSPVLGRTGCPGGEQGLPMCQVPSQPSRRRFYCARCAEAVDTAVEHWRCFGCDCRACGECVEQGETCMDLGPRDAEEPPARVPQPQDQGDPPRREGDPPPAPTGAPATGRSDPTATEEGSNPAQAPATSMSSQPKRKRESASPQRGQEMDEDDGATTVGEWEEQFCPDVHRPQEEQEAALRAIQAWWAELGDDKASQAEAYNVVCCRLRARAGNHTLAGLSQTGGHTHVDSAIVLLVVCVRNDKKGKGNG